MVIPEGKTDEPDDDERDTEHETYYFFAAPPNRMRLRPADSS